MSEVLYEGPSYNVINLTLQYISKEDHNIQTDKAIMDWLLKDFIHIGRNLSLNNIDKLYKNMSFHHISTVPYEHCKIHIVAVIIKGEPSLMENVSSSLLYSQSGENLPANYSGTFCGETVTFRDLYFVSGIPKTYSMGSGKIFCISELGLDNFGGKSQAMSKIMEKTQDIPFENAKVIKTSTESKQLRNMTKKLLGYGYSGGYNTIRITLEANYKVASDEGAYKWIKLEDPYSVRSDIYRNPYGVVSKIKIHNINKTLILTDSEKAYIELKDKIAEYLKVCNHNLIFINQYNIDTVYQHINNIQPTICLYKKSELEQYTSSEHVLIITIPSINKLSHISSYDNHKVNLRTYESVNTIGFHMNYFKSKESKKCIKLSNVVLSNSILDATKEESIILPFNYENHSYVELLDKYIQYKANERDRVLKETLKETILQLTDPQLSLEDEEDVLNIWFKRNTSDADSERDKLKKSYLDLKRNLLKEYKEINMYINNVNLSNKLPVPSITFDKKGKTILSSSNGLFMKETPINQINGLKLRIGVIDRSLSIRYIIKDKKHRYNTSLKEMPLDNIYRKDTNELIFDYQVLKNYKGGE